MDKGPLPSIWAKNENRFMNSPQKPGSNDWLRNCNYSSKWNKKWLNGFYNRFFVFCRRLSVRMSPIPGSGRKLPFLSFYHVSQQISDSKNEPSRKITPHLPLMASLRDQLAFIWAQVPEIVISRSPLSVGLLTYYGQGNVNAAALRTLLIETILKKNLL